jgi:hypothetical protein
MLINTINKKNFITTVDMASMQNALRSHIGWSGYGKSRLSNVTYYDDILTHSSCCDIDDDYVMCHNHEHNYEQNYERDEFGFRRSLQKVRLQMPVSKYAYKKTQPVLIVNRQKKRVYDLF